MDNNNNTPNLVFENLSSVSSQHKDTNNVNYPDINKEYGKPVIPQDVQQEVSNDIVYRPGIQFSINELGGTLDIPEDVDDIAYPTELFPQAPVMFVVESKNSIAQESGKDAIGEDIKRSKKATNIRTWIVARMYISNVVRYDEYYQLSGFYRTLQNQIINFEFSFDTDKYRDNFRRAFIDNKVDCFNDKIKQTDISRYLKILLERKALQGVSPDKLGFFAYNNILYFACVEFCESYHLPQKVKKHFKLFPTFMPDIIKENFVDSVKRHEDKLLYMLLNIIRIAGIYSSLFNTVNTSFCKIAVIKGITIKYHLIFRYMEGLLKRKKNCL